MEVKILGRSTTNWGGYKYTEQFIEQFMKWYNHEDGGEAEGARRGPIPKELCELFANNIRVWDKHFNMTYTKFRAKLKKISQENWGKTGCKIIYNKTNDNDDCIYMPSDDDDWFHPQIAERVKEVFDNHDNIDIVRWDCWRFASVNSPESFARYRRKPNGKGHAVGSNGYALRSGLETQVLYGNHTSIDKYDPIRTFYLPEPLSIWVGHPGSFFYLIHHDSNDIFQKPLPEKKKIPKFLRWAKPEIDKKRYLMKRLIGDKE